MENLQVKTDKETFDRFLTSFEKSGCTTRSEFMKKLLEALENPQGLEPDEKIEELNKSNALVKENLKEAASQLQLISEAIPDHALIASDNDIVNAIKYLNSENERLYLLSESSNDELKKMRDSMPVNPDNFLGIDFTSEEKHILQETCKRLGEKQGQTIVPEVLLKQVFFVYTYKGPCDFFPRVFSKKELTELHNQYKSE